ncbi:MAG: hypothetical protein Tp152SUR00d2C52646391_54 [Prokaryotic dsDNA virus sp.]|nr:MAG: hypothetical protein Tp152SUR00d2C52646391_54 [Prokaryotic dsDNA virus sp.]|tara:strand:- start:569 stop:829 length:261 start_codon:yes stop_codon:yes gene_type:complete
MEFVSIEFVILTAFVVGVCFGITVATRLVKTNQSKYDKDLVKDLVQASEKRLLNDLSFKIAARPNNERVLTTVTRWLEEQTALRNK